MKFEAGAMDPNPRVNWRFTKSKQTKGVNHQQFNNQRDFHHFKLSEVSTRLKELLRMRGLKSATGTSASSTTTIKGKRKLAQTKDYPDSPPATPPPETNGKRGKGRISEINSPPPKRRRSSDRIAKQMQQKRGSFEDDDGFVFTRPAKKKAATITSKADVVKSTSVSKPFVMDFTEVFLLWYKINIDSCCHEEPVPTFSTNETNSTPYRLSNRNKRHRRRITYFRHTYHSTKSRLTTTGHWTTA
jgi:hypothetical protein